MMLLQAGQLGLYRKDSIWTDMLPPEMYAGCTLWADGTDTSTLLDSTGGSPVTTDGAPVLIALNKINPLNCFRGSASDVKPQLKIPAVNGKSALAFINNAAVTTTASDGVSEVAASALLTATIKLIVVAVRVNAVPSDSGSYNNAMILGVRGWLGLHYYSTGASTCAAVGINYDQNGPQEATVAFAKGAWVILTMSQQSNQLRVRVNGGAWATTASLATGDMSLPMRLCEQSISGGSHDIELAHIATFNTTQTDPAISAVERWIANDLGITPWW